MDDATLALAKRAVLVSIVAIVGGAVLLGAYAWYATAFPPESPDFTGPTHTTAEQEKIKILEDFQKSVEAEGGGSSMSDEEKIKILEDFQKSQTTQ